MNNIEQEPYYMKNPNWYKIIKSKENILDVKIVLTDKAPKKAVESYKEDIKRSKLYVSG